MSKSFLQYLQESEKSFGFCIKTVMPMDDACMERIERLLQPYNLLNIGAPHLVSGKVGLEFQTQPNAQEVHVDCTLGMPVSSYVLLQVLKTGLNIPEDTIIVRAANEPLEVENTSRQLLSDLAAKAKEKDLKEPGSLLSTDPHYLAAEQPLVKDAYGDKYNKKFLELLADISASRESREVEPASGQISLAAMKKVKREPTQDLADFNDRFDTPKPVTKSSKTAEAPVDSKFLSEPGNFDDEVQHKFKLNKNKKGELVVNTAENTPIRKPRK